MNKAFRDQISRIKERQDENEVSSFQNVTQYEQSFERPNKRMLDIEISQTPDQLHQEIAENYKTKTTNLNNKRNRSPTTINPLCTSESYCMLKGFMSNQSANPLDKIQANKAQFNTVANTNLGGSLVGLACVASNLPTDIRLDCKIEEFPQEYHTAPQTSTFGGQQNIGLGSENIEPDLSESKFDKINKTNQAPMVFRVSDIVEEQESPDINSNRNGFSSTMNRKKSDTRYQLRESNLDQEYALEFEQEKDMFDDFINSNNILSRKPSLKTVKLPNKDQSIMNQTSTLSELSRKINLLQCSKLGSQQELPPSEVNEKEMKRSMQQQTAQTYREQRKNVKQMLISPKFTDDESSFIPNGINRELLNEMAANYKMMELTPDGDFKSMMAH